MKYIEAIAVLNGKNCKGTVNIKELGNNMGLEFTGDLQILNRVYTDFIFTKQEILKKDVKVVAFISIR